ncbi:MAG: acetyl-CoA acetyltransferase [Syntrophales bacterium]|jgi:acetyl-CoA C-acetyltransferase|nr:acetyl-CoA acetyltransferase [Syntrophales bacterium]MDY0045077.1 acetyl-CoA acetyltransferase [Syntrophales bacterium]
MPGSIKDRVAIVGMGCTRFGERWDVSAADMIVEAVYQAYEDAGIETKDIQAAWLGTATGMTGMVLSEPLRLQYIPVTRVENACATASDAFRNACYAVAAGIYDMVLAVGVDKFKDSGISGLGDGGAPGPSHAMEAESTPPRQFAMLATTYFSKYGLSFEEGKHMIGRVSWKSHQNGMRNKNAHFQKDVSMDTILNAPMVAWPLGLFDCCGVSDGAAAAIITTPEIAQSMRKDPVYVKALQISMAPRDGNFNTNYDFLHVEATVRAAEAAYKEAGIKNPREEISMAEVHDCFSITEAVTMEDLRFSPRGKVRDDIENGFFDLDGGLPVQLDGGLKCFGHPIGASGLRMLYEMYLQLQGRADELLNPGFPSRQLANPKLGLTHNLGGSPDGCAIFVGIVGLPGV